LCVTPTICAQQTLSVEELKDDLKILEDISLEVSPGINEKDKVLISQKIEEALSSLKEPVGTVDFFEFLAGLNLPTKVDEHGNYTLPGEILESIFDDARLFPLPLSFVGDNLMVNIKGADIPYGCFIKSINGVSLEDITRKFTDNFTNNYYKMRVELQLSYLLLILTGSSDSYEVIYYPESNFSTQKKVVLRGVDFTEFKEIQSKKIYPQNREALKKLINTQYLPSQQTFIFQLNSFSWDEDYPTNRISAFYSEEEEFEASFENVFDKIKASAAKNLIIDLRYNSGGNTEIPAKLLSYIAKESFSETINLSIPDFQIPHQDCITQIGKRSVSDVTEVRTYIRNIKKNYKATDSAYVQPYFENVKRNPRPNAFDGDVYLLTGNRTTSASSYFTAMFKAYGRGTIVGKSTGGSHRSVTAGRILKYQLPNSKIEVYAPMMLVTYSDEIYKKVPEYFIKPHVDIQLADRYQYMLDLKDPELSETLKIIDLLKNRK
jgi:hypothetical protein